MTSKQAVDFFYCKGGRKGGRNKYYLTEKKEGEGILLTPFLLPGCLFALPVFPFLILIFIILDVAATSVTSVSLLFLLSSCSSSPFSLFTPPLSVFERFCTLTSSFHLLRLMVCAHQHPALLLYFSPACSFCGCEKSSKNNFHRAFSIWSCCIW